MTELTPNTVIAIALLQNGDISVKYSNILFEDINSHLIFDYTNNLVYQIDSSLWIMLGITLLIAASYILPSVNDFCEASKYLGNTNFNNSMPNCNGLGESLVSSSIKLKERLPSIMDCINSKSFNIYDYLPSEIVNHKVSLYDNIIQLYNPFDFSYTYLFDPKILPISLTGSIFVYTLNNLYTRNITSNLPQLLYNIYNSSSIRAYHFENSESLNRFFHSRDGIQFLADVRGRIRTRIDSEWLRGYWLHRAIDYDIAHIRRVIQEDLIRINSLFRQLQVILTDHDIIIRPPMNDQQLTIEPNNNNPLLINSTIQQLTEQLRELDSSIRVLNRYIISNIIRLNTWEYMLHPGITGNRASRHVLRENLFYHIFDFDLNRSLTTLVDPISLYGLFIHDIREYLGNRYTHFNLLDINTYEYNFNYDVPGDNEDNVYSHNFDYGYPDETSDSDEDDNHTQESGDEGYE